MSKNSKNKILVPSLFAIVSFLIQCGLQIIGYTNIYLGFVLLISAYLFGAYAFFIWRPNLHWLLRIIIVAVVGFLYFGSIIYFKNEPQKQITPPPMPPPVVKKIPNVKKIPVVYKPFMSAYEKHKTKLGKPIEEVKSTKNASEDEHEYATVIWSDSLAKYYRLSKKDDNFSKYPQPTWDLDLKYLNIEWLTKRFSPTKGFKPPYSQLAALWDVDEKNWSWIGFRKWHSYFDSIHYQRFEHGIIIGSFPKYPTYKNKDLLFILFDDSRWDLQESETLLAAKCIQAPDDNMPSVRDYQSEPASTLGK